MSSSVDYRDLARQYPRLGQFLVPTSRGATIDFNNPAAVRMLNQALYQVSLGISISLPEDRLCPPVRPLSNKKTHSDTVRIEIDGEQVPLFIVVSLLLTSTLLRRYYMNWIRQLHLHSACDESPVIIDIGTGASAVYPLVGCSTWPEAQFFATELDQISYGYAEGNVIANDMQSRITLVKTSPSDHLLQPLFAHHNLRYFATMCNPPFYQSEEDMQRRAASKESPALTVYTGAATESVTPGGEVAFVEKMIRESVLVQSRCIWFTSMLGLASSLERLVEVLQSLHISNYAVNGFTSGTGTTRRWLLGWSFKPVRLPDDVVRSGGNAIVEPASTSIDRPLNVVQPASFPTSTLVCTFWSVLLAISNLQISALAPLPLPVLVAARITATSVTWTRKARRAHLHNTASGESATSPAEPILICVVSLRLNFADVETDGKLVLGAQWEYGRERAAFETFGGHFSSKLSDAISDYVKG
ncbi:hypothetical protein BKA62DRAFT_703169 [Auriculariales sp. MPI-PUGE-AT-0066]|nr:hypothetical protein BKA62DRAFT_703169 [Auriculariales sp. MPI-PUGE-AT-0066]